MTRVSLWECDYESVGEAVEQAVATYAPPIEGRKVLIKPNMLGPTKPDRHICTHPSVLRAAIEAVERRDPAVLWVGDNPGMRAYGSNEQTARVSGHLAVAGDYFVNLGSSPVRTDVRSDFADQLAFSREVLEADVLVSLPKMKTHVATGITGAVKNCYGHLVGGEKTRLHRDAVGQENFARAVVDVFAVRPPDLAILDAVFAMEGEGPSGGKVRRVGRLVASDNAVALDTVMAAMMGLEPRQVAMLRIAEERGFGPATLDGIELDGPFEVVPDFRVPMVGRGIGTWLSRLAGMLVVKRPRVVYKKCVKCASCAKACPVEAITMTDEGPVIDYKKCIACFCCHEMCRYEAMALRSRMRLLQGLPYIG